MDGISRIICKCDEGRCRCECGYRCGGPGICALDTLECLRQTDGKHYVKDCDHDFTGPMIEVGMGASSTCKKCGMTSLSHDMRFAP